MSDELEEQPIAAPQEPDWKAATLRAQADYANLQKDLAAQRIQMMTLATAHAVEKFLPVYDYFKRAMAHVPAADEQSPAVQNWMTGTGHIAQLFKSTLAQLGVTEMETVGKPFDPSWMEAIKEEPAEGVAPGTVLTEVAGGYEMSGKIIKPAQVIVAAETK